MINFLKNFIRYFWRQKIILFSALLVLFFLSLPLPTLAAWDVLRNAIWFLPTAFVATLLIISIITTQAIAFVMGAILDWVISPNFVSLSYTQPDTNPIIKMGLNITQSFVNLLLVVILVYIALAIALRIGEHNAKKLFPRLIAVALLVNFAPVFCGLIVDASNIIMNYFLTPIRGGVSGALTQVSPFIDAVKKSIWGAGGELPTRLGVLAMGASQIFLNLAIAFAFFLFAGIFIFRYIAIWVLVILAPIAFVFWILPQTKKLWDMWWNNFIQWSIIGIPMAFFLYLGLGSFSAISTAFEANLKISGFESGAVGWLNQVFPFFVTVIFLVLGFLIGLSSAAMGSATVMNWTKTAGKVAGKWAAKKAGRGGADILRRATKGKASEWMAKQATARLPGLKGKGWGGKIATVAGYATGAIPAYWAVRRGIGAAGLRTTEAEIADVKKSEEKYKGTTELRKASAIRKPGLLSTERIAALKQSIEENQLDDVKKILGHTGGKDPTKDKEIDNEIVKIGRAALRINPEVFKKIRDAFPHLAEQMGEGFTEAVREKAGLTLTTEDIAVDISSIPVKIVAKIKPSLVPKMDKDAFKNTEVKRAIQQYWTGSHIAEAAKEIGKSFIDDFQKDFNKLEEKEEGWHERSNPLLDRFVRNTAAQALGLKHPRGEEEE